MRARACVCNDSDMTTFVDKLVAEEHHLEEVAGEGYEPARWPGNSAARIVNDSATLSGL